MPLNLSKMVFLLLMILISRAHAQNMEIVLGPDAIGENQVWTITITVTNENLRTYENPPEFEGLRRRGTSTQSQTSIVNGQISSSYSVVINYQPTRQGIVTIPAFRIKVNGKEVSTPGKRVKVGPPVQMQAQDPFRGIFDRDPFEDFFGKRETEFVDVKEEAFLALSTSKDEVYVGEGFTATLSFFVSESNKAPMQFHELGEQLTGLLKKLRPEACWEENFNIENIEGEHVLISGKDYTQYRIYQAAFYPLNSTAIVFPSVGLRMIKFKVAKNPSFFGQNRQEDFKTFYSTPRTVRVKELPPHPLRESVAVGNFRLEDRLQDPAVETGKSTGFDFTVIGEGNISGIPKPTVIPDRGLELFDPNIRQNITRQNGRVAGAKTFSYFMIPQEPGEFDLGQHLFMVYFNPSTRAYDTLRPLSVLKVTGESRSGVATSGNDVNSFYDRIDLADNTLVAMRETGYFRMAVNIFILLTLGASVYLVFKK